MTHTGDQAAKPGAGSWNGLGVAVLAGALLLAGAGMRLIRLDRVPLGLQPDEACNGYDAYCLLRTGRDQHGNFLPLAIQAFNDYRMPLFDYSIVPLIAAFGLRPAAVRSGAALWGILDMTAITMLGGAMFGTAGAVAAALLCAFSPWHLHLSRYGHEAMSSSAVVSLAMLCFFLWLRRQSDRWLWLTAICLGLSLYTYSVTKLVTALLIAWIAILYRHELWRAKTKALTALGIIGLLALPQMILIWSRPTEMLARYHEISITSDWSSTSDRLEQIGAHMALCLGPAFLFLTGDHSEVLHVQGGFGELLPEQAPLIVLAMLALFSTRRRRIALLLLGWVIWAALPAAMIRGARWTSLHNVLGMAPWILLSTLGFVVLLDLARSLPLLKTVAAGLILGGALYHGLRYAGAYFGRYPADSARAFQYGLKDVVSALDSFGDQNSLVVFPLKDISAPYIYVLFFARYPPALFQRGPVLQVPGVGGQVLRFGRYVFASPDFAYEHLAHGIFVFAGSEAPPRAPALTVVFPDGSPAYNVVVK
jgi:4-amino-4-deoxy-L-arabinose transferase-like glycosyltransferase